MVGGWGVGELMDGGLMFKVWGFGVEVLGFGVLGFNFWGFAGLGFVV